MAEAASARRLMSELQGLYKEKWVHIDVDDRSVHKWTIGLMVVNPESVFNGAYLNAEMRFPSDYPYSPPKFKFLTQGISHPNIYANGELCISILHKPGEDEQSGEQACERWSPLQGAESVLRSVLLLLDDPEINSPANVDAGVLYRDHREEYVKRAKAVAVASREDMPDHIVFPAQKDLEPVPQKQNDDDAFWQESDEDVDFDDLGGSDSDFDMDEYNEDDEEEDDDDVSQKPGSKDSKIKA